MKDSILVNIDVIIEYLKSGKGLLPMAYEKYSMKITATTFAELLASKTFKDDSLESEVMDFLKKYFEVLDVDQDLALEASKVMREYELNFAQSIVAAAAKSKGMDLLTSETKTFEKVEGVKILGV
jgi:predicted nucleic acid-binding protein